MKKAKLQIVVMFFLILFIFSGLSSVYAMSTVNKTVDQKAVAIQTDNPKTGIDSGFGSGIILFLVGTGAVAGTILLRKFHNEDKTRHRMD